jgi:hypothetical protein
VQAFLKGCGIKSRTSTSNNHQAVGGIEAWVKKVVNALRILAVDNKRDWDNLIAATMVKLRTEKLTDMGVSSYEQRYGKQYRSPAHLEFGTETRTLTAEKAQEMRQRADEAADKAALKQKERYDKHRAEISFDVGDWVYLKDHYRRKLGLKNIGPFEIAEKKSDLSYKIKDCVGGPKLGRRWSKRFSRTRERMARGSSRSHGQTARRLGSRSITSTTSRRTALQVPGRDKESGRKKGDVSDVIQTGALPEARSEGI